MTEDRLLCGVFPSAEQLTTVVFDCLDHNSEIPNPVIRTAKANDILERVKRTQAALQNS